MSLPDDFDELPGDPLTPMQTAELRVLMTQHGWTARDVAQWSEVTEAEVERALAGANLTFSEYGDRIMWSARGMHSLVSHAAEQERAHGEEALEGEHDEDDDDLDGSRPRTIAGHAIRALRRAVKRRRKR